MRSPDAAETWEEGKGKDEEGEEYETDQAFDTGIWRGKTRVLARCRDRPVA
jgi:hypothetical protein